MLLSLAIMCFEEKKMKKTILLLTAIILISLSGCSKPPASEQEKTTETVTTQAVATQTEKKDNIDGKIITNEGLLNELNKYVEDFYFNFLFSPKSETGIITEADMKIFAISHIFQFDNKDLRFDSEKFVLYIPQEKVAKIIKTYFDYEIKEHNSPENPNITYAEGYYQMKAINKEIKGKPVIKEAFQMDNGKYKLRIFSTDTSVKEYSEAVVEEKNGKFILVTYKRIIPKK